MLLLYAVVPAEPQSPHPGLSVLSGAEVAVLYEERGELPSTDRDEVLAFGRVVSEVAARGGPMLPVRYGTVVQTADDLVALLAEREEDWHQRLAVVRGHVELVVRVTDAAAPAKAPAVAGAGREYLLSRASAHRHAEELFAELASALVPCCREVRRLPGSDELRVACLVPSDAVEDLRASLETWTGARDGRSARVTGPWPPFSFTEEDELS